MPIVLTKKNDPAKQTEILWREAFIIVLLLTAQLLGSGVAVFTYLTLSVWALRGPKYAIQALCLSWFFSFLNPGIFPEFLGSGSLRWAVFITAFIRVIQCKMTLNRRISPEIIYLTLFILFAVLVSIFKSYEPGVSFFKLVMFAMGVITALFAFELTSDQKRYWQSWFTTFFLLILVLGFPFFFFGLGYTKDGHGFQGLLNHPQDYATFLAPMVAWLTGQMLFERNRSFPILIGVSLGWFSLFFTLARTGILAIVLGCVLVIIIGILKRAQWRRTLFHVFGNNLSMLGFCILCIFIVMNFSSLSQYTKDFMQKGTTNENFIDIYADSRGALIKKSMENFLDNPWTGIGFGVASDPSSFEIKRDSVFGLPIGAPVEKGFMPSAILEEVGIIGAGLLILFIISLIRPILKWGSLPALWLFFTSLLINMGEMDFFSFGGMGLYIWLMIGLSRLAQE